MFNSIRFIWVLVFSLSVVIFLPIRNAEAQVLSNRPRNDDLYRHFLSVCLANPKILNINTIEAKAMIERIGSSPSIAACLTVGRAISEALGQNGEVETKQLTDLLKQLVELNDEIRKLRERVEIDLANVLNKP